MELVVSAFRDELQLLRDLVNKLSPPPVPPKPPTVPPPPPVPKTNTNWKGRSRAPAAPPKVVPEDFRQQMARYKTYYNKYPNTLKDIPLIEFRKVDRLIPKGANLRPTLGVGNNKFKSVLQNAVNKYKQNL
jgi:hypothetical protein